MSKATTPLFLQRQSYRGRRLIDFLRILPMIGGFLWAVPLLWSTDPEHGVSTSVSILYIFGVWILMILASALVSIFLRRAGLNVTQEDG